MDQYMGYVLPGAREAINELKKKFNIVIYSARVSDDLEALKEMKNWLKKNQIYFDDIKEKVVAEVYIDDRAVRADPNNGYSWSNALNGISEIENKIEKQKK